MGKLSVCLAPALPLRFAAKKADQRRIPDLVRGFRVLWAFVWKPVCHSLPACRSILCPCLLALRAYVGRMAWRMEFCPDDHFGKTTVQTSFQAEIYLNLTAVPYAITSAAPCITAEEA